MRAKDKYGQKVRVWKKIFHANEKKAGLAVLTLVKIDFKTKSITRDKGIT